MYINFYKKANKIILYLFLTTLVLISTAVQTASFADTELLTLEQKKEINTYGNQIEYLIQQNNLSEAFATANKMVIQYPKEPNSYFILAKTIHHIGDRDNAIYYYKKCLTLDSTYYQAYFNIGLIKYQQKNYNDAIKYYNRSIKISSKDNKYKLDTALAYSNRALAKYYQGHLKSALKDYNKSISNLDNYPNIDHIYYNRGLCKYDLNDKIGAYEDFKKAKNLNPKFKYVYYNVR